MSRNSRCKRMNWRRLYKTDGIIQIWRFCLSMRVIIWKKVWDSLTYRIDCVNSGQTFLTSGMTGTTPLHLGQSYCSSRRCVRWRQRSSAPPAAPCNWSCYAEIGRPWFHPFPDFACLDHPFLASWGSCDDFAFIRGFSLHSEKPKMVSEFENEIDDIIRLKNDGRA